MEREIQNKIKISPYSKIKVDWLDQPHNYSKEAKNRVRNHFAKKYGINVNSVTVIYHPIKFNEKGDTIEITDSSIENIMDVNYQRALMKEIITRDGKTVDFDRILALDAKVNSEIDVDLTVSQHKKWSIKWIMIDNFLSFGSDNYLAFSKLKGLTVVNSTPSNASGKTSLIIDSIKFLLHGTTTKTDKNEQIFNTYSGKDELVVRGMLEIENEDIIIERKMKRTGKKTGEWNVTNKVNLYVLLPDGEEKMMNEEDSKKTTKKLKESIGGENDFELLALATEKNLDDLIGLTTTESGKVLTRLIGLEVLELKEVAVRKMYNEFNNKKKSNEYDVVTLTNEITTHEEKVEEGDELEALLNKKLIDAKFKITNLNIEKDKLLNSKEKIDVTIIELNPSKLASDIEILTKSGIALKEKLGLIKEKIKEIGVITFDEDEHHELTKNLTKNTSELAVKKSEVDRLKSVVDELIAGGICKSCNRKLDTVDNTEHIKKHEKDIDILNKNIDKIKIIIDGLNTKLEGIVIIKKRIDEKNKLELDSDRVEVEMGGLRNQIVSKSNDLKKYNLNLEAIELNKKVDIQISLVKTNLQVEEHTKDETITRIERIVNDIKNNKTSIELKKKLIETIKKEEEVEKIFKIYIDLVGKKGISKLVLRSVLPIINSEVQRLLENVCDFEIEIFMDDKNDVQFLINRDGVSKMLKSASGFEKTASSIALRTVLCKMSTLPMPNFISFDEVLGKVAPDNIDKLKSLFDKIKDMYDIVFLITHNDAVLDWSDRIITVVKENNISKIIVK